MRGMMENKCWNIEMKTNNKKTLKHRKKIWKRDEKREDGETVELLKN